MADVSPSETTQTRARNLTESTGFQNFILVIIALNAVVLGLETSRDLMASYGFWLGFLDRERYGVCI